MEWLNCLIRISRTSCSSSGEPFCFFALTRASRGEGWQRLRAARLSLSLLPGLMLHQLLWPLLEALQVVIGLKVTRGFLEDGKDWRLFRIHHLIRSEPGSR